jgi:hypothetical protein
MATFHPFLRLPAELRSQIWKSTVEPRIIDVEVRRERGGIQAPYLVSHTAVPAVLQTCREARNEGLYQQAFSEIAGTDDHRRRYVWAALNVDTIDIGETLFEDFKPVASVIQRLRFERSNSDEFFYHSEVQELRDFVNVKEIQVVCADGLRSWDGAIEDHYFPCGAENIVMIDPEDGHLMKATDLDEMLDRERKELYFQDDYEYYRSSYWLL